MPAAGTRVPDSETASAWRSWIIESHDGAGNITHQQIADNATSTDGASITRASGRGFGRLAGRTRFFGIAGNAVEQTYGYADGLGAGSAPGPASGLMGKSTIAIGSFVLAGTEIARDTARREEISKDLGLSTRATNFGYDNRGRLTSSELLGEGGGSVRDTLVPADFRQNRTVKTDARDLAELGSLASQVAIPSWTATQTDLHQYDTRTVANESTGRTYAFDAGRRTSDGSWTSEYDPEGRVAALQKGSERIEFTYGPTGRLVGRHAFKKNGAAWDNEDRQSILDADGLPAETTFVWDPVVDRLVAIFEANNSAGSAPAPDAGLVRQYLHGDQGYDDPVEVTTKRSDGAIVRYLPLIDEAGSGSLQAVVAPSGLLAERVLYADAYGDSPRYLQGAVVDKIEIEPTKSADGTMSKVTVRVHLSETIDAATVSTGLRVSAVSSTGAVVATASTQPTASGATISMSIPGSDWAALASTPGATQVEIAVTNTLRAAVWDGPVMPLPAWLLQDPSRRSATQFPVIQRESFASLASFAASLNAGETRAETLLQIHDLYLAASNTSITKLLTGYKAAPFIEPRSGYAYFRNRWYSPEDGTWLTPDEMAFADGSNSYAAMACNPIQNSDPTGTLSAKSVAAMKAASIRTVEGAVIGIGVSVGATLSAPVTATAAAAIGIYNLGKNIYHREQQYDALGWGDHWVEAASVGLGDTIGMTGFVEGTADRELVSGRDLSEEEAGERLGDSIGQQVGVLAATALYRPVQGAVRTSSPYRQFSRDLAAAAIRDARTDLAASGVASAKINRYMCAFEFESVRYGREFNFWSRHYRFYTSGGSAGGRWLTDDIGLLDESPFGRKVSLALPASNAADAAAWTRIPLGRYVVSGVTAPRPPSFTGLPPSALTGGPRQQYVISFPGQSYLHFTVHP
jgi:RHS repeat-associated protein